MELGAPGAFGPLFAPDKAFFALPGAFEAVFAPKGRGLGGRHGHGYDAYLPYYMCVHGGK